MEDGANTSSHDPPLSEARDGGCLEALKGDSLLGWKHVRDVTLTKGQRSALDLVVQVAREAWGSASLTVLQPIVKRCGLLRPSSLDATPYRLIRIG